MKPPPPGLGVDGVTPVDFQRLPQTALQEMALQFTAIEDPLTRPIQTQVTLGKLTPEKTGTNRAIRM
eukprot:5352125-Pyramimonas_sp.AAC.1